MMSDPDPWDPLAERKQLEKVLSMGIELRRGDHVRLRPRAGGDIFDLALAGKAATIAEILQDFEHRIHLAVTVDEDPGRDFGMDGKPGHRFFFSPEEVEIIGAEDDDGSDTPMTLSEPVAAAVDPAVAMIESLIESLIEQLTVEWVNRPHNPNPQEISPCIP